jgi:hypothetical protein
MLQQLQGREFDWFAVDGDQNIAMFATAGEGFIPEEVIRHLSQHESLSDQIPAPHTGTAQVWNDYAAVGLYVFDWNLPGGPYVLRATPSRPMANEFRRSVRSIVQLPVYGGSFSSLSKLSSWAVNEDEHE